MSRLKSLFCCCRKKTAWAHATRCSCQTNVIFHIIFHPTQPMLLTAPVKQTSYSTSYPTPLSPCYSLLLSNKRHIPHHIPPHSAHATRCFCQTNIIFHHTQPMLLIAPVKQTSYSTSYFTPLSPRYSFSCQTNIIFHIIFHPTQLMPLIAPVKQTSLFHPTQPMLFASPVKQTSYSD